MKRTTLIRINAFGIAVLFLTLQGYSQLEYNKKFIKSNIFAGIEIGSKGIKMSVVEIGKNVQSSGEFHLVKDTSINTDFISFTQSTFDASLDAVTALYMLATVDYKIPAKRVFTVISSGVKMQADKENKQDWIANIITAFQKKINEPGRKVELTDVLQEARLSHIGIVPNNRRYSTFLIDIGSGNTKGGFFPYGNIKDFKLFQLSWGTKTVANASEKLLENDKSLTAYRRQMRRVIDGAEQNEIIYAVNSSGAYPLSDNIACSGGISWSIATLIAPELIGNSVVPVTYEEVLKFSETLFSDFASLSPEALTNKIKDPSVDKAAVLRETKRVHGVFDQRSLLAGTGLLLKIMRQFKSIFETKQFYLVKNGQVGWISAYVEDAIE